MAEELTIKELAVNNVEYEKHEARLKRAEKLVRAQEEKRKSIKLLEQQLAQIDKLLDDLDKNVEGCLTASYDGEATIGIGLGISTPSHILEVDYFD